MAQSDLIVLIFELMDDACWARRALQMMRGHTAFGLEHAAEITRDSSGQTTLHHRWALPTHLYNPRSRLASLLAAVIFGYRPHDEQFILNATGLDERFLTTVTSALVPSSSALLIFVPHDSMVIDRAALLRAISLLRGTLYRTSLPVDAEEALLSYAQHAHTQGANTSTGAAQTGATGRRTKRSRKSA